MSPLRVFIPIVVLALTAIAAAVPSVISADDSAAVTIHEGADPSTWGFTPTTTTIAAGQSVTWTNSGTFAHDAAATDGSWKTALLNHGLSAAVTFSTAGTFTYICTPHPWMQGTIVVTPAVITAPTAVPVADVPIALNPTVDAAPAPAVPVADVPAVTDPTPVQPDDATTTDNTGAGN